MPCLVFQAKTTIRYFIKPSETLERSLEINKHKGRKQQQKRPNYKNIGEDEEEEKGPEEAQEGSEGPSKGVKPSGEREGALAEKGEPHGRGSRAGLINCPQTGGAPCRRLGLLSTPRGEKQSERAALDQRVPPEVSAALLQRSRW